MGFLRKIMKKAHRRPKTDKLHQDPPNLPEGQLGSYSENIKNIQEVFQGCSDIKLRELAPGMVTDDYVYVVYIESLVKIEMVEDSFRAIHTLSQQPEHLRPNEVSGFMEISEIDSLKNAATKVLEGWTLFFVKKTGKTFVVNTYAPPTRSIERSETESVILGPQEAFNESIQTSLSLMRRRIKSPDMKVTSISIGKYTQRYACILHMEGIAEPGYVEAVTERLKHISIDSVQDAGDLAQMIDDNPFSPFPQFHLTERPEKVASHLLDGKVAILVDGSSFALTAPATFIEFFQSPEDYSNRWFSASVIRALRLFGMFVSISLSALYVAVITFHYQLIPGDMLVTLTESRARVPFPPLYETLLMEITIELLREAGARLPTKTGQTIGIVGGIVIGQAAVAAGLTSNILIIAVALSTIASFITPSYVMSSALRAIRFPLIFMAGLYGLFGMMIGILIMVIHVLRLSSLGSPYFTPFSPLRLSDWKDTFMRAPFSWMVYRPTTAQPLDSQRQVFQDEVTPPVAPLSKHASSDTSTNTSTDTANAGKNGENS